MISGVHNINLNRWVSRGLDVRAITINDNNYCLKRNIGANAARGEIVAYIDDDATASPAWIDAVEKGFRSDWKFAGGRVEPNFEDEIPDKLKGDERLIGGFNYLPDIGYSTETIIGCNMYLDRRWLLKTGGFDEYIGKMNMTTPKQFHGGDEIEILRKLMPEQIGFIPDAQVFHTIQKFRMNQDYIISRAYGNGKVKRYIDNKHNSRSITFKNLIKRCVKNMLYIQHPKSRRDFMYLKGYFSSITGR